MNIKTIRDKYRQILDEDDSDSSFEQPQKTAIVKYATQKTHILTEHTQNLSFSNITSSQPSSKMVIALKERIAQGLRNLNQKQQEKTVLQKNIIKLQEKIKLMQEELNEAKLHIQKGQHRLIEEKVTVGSLTKEIQRLQEIIEDSHVDKQLIMKQAEFYKTQVSNVKKQKKGVFKLVQSFQKEAKMIQKVKSENHRLREDIKRIHVILNEYSQSNMSKHLQDKHYLGKPYKQHNSWFSQNLIGQVQQFLKKQQVGQNNKQFMHSLIKFIDRYSKVISKERKTKPKDNYSQVKAQQSKSHIRSSSVFDMGESYIKSTQGLGTSLFKKSLLVSKIMKNASKKCTQSLILPEKNRSLSILCEQILDQFYKIMQQALNEKQIKRKKILRLVKEMRSSIFSLLEMDKSQIN